MEILINIAAVTITVVAFIFLCIYECKKEDARLAAGGLPRKMPVYNNSGSDDIYPEYNVNGIPMIEGMGVDMAGNPFGTTGDDD